jgi:hypothetical protein
MVARLREVVRGLDAIELAADKLGRLIGSVGSVISKPAGKPLGLTGMPEADCRGESRHVLAADTQIVERAAAVTPLLSGSCCVGELRVVLARGIDPAADTERAEQSLHVAHQIHRNGSQTDVTSAVSSLRSAAIRIEEAPEERCLDVRGGFQNRSRHPLLGRPGSLDAQAGEKLDDRTAASPQLHGAVGLLGRPRCHAENLRQHGPVPLQEIAAVLVAVDPGGIWPATRHVRRSAPNATVADQPAEEVGEFLVPLLRKMRAIAARILNDIAGSDGHAGPHAERA